jgi:hypothetical protein
MKPPYHIKDPQLQLMIRELYDRVGKVEPAVQKVQDQVSSIRAVVGGTGVETILMPDGTERQMQANLPDTTKIGKATGAGMAIPSSYFLDLRLYNSAGGTPTTRYITADWLTLHDNSTPWKTLGLTNINVSCNVNLVGPAPGGRDQAAQFASGWIYFYVIYSSAKLSTSATVSQNATTPVLATDYDYYVKVGSGWCANMGPVSYITTGAQIGDKVWDSNRVMTDGDPLIVDSLQSLSLTNFIPSSAKVVFGYFGLTSDPGANPNMGVSSDTTSSDYLIMVTLSIAGGYAGSTMKGSTYFELPIITSQTIYWRASIDQARYGIDILGWVDDL